ncbi:MAG: hypothetical protein WKG32_03525 [Gemmatimonadaceae bacterium]
MTAAELVAARERLGLTVDEMAAELALTPHAYRACETGSVTLPRRYAEVVAYRAGVAEREAALVASGIPECAWARSFEEELGRGSREPAPLRARVETHIAGCETCQARARFVRERFPDPPPIPMPRWVRGLDRVGTWVSARPSWVRPAIIGAAALAAMALIRVLIALPAAIRNPEILALALGAVVLAAVAGAAGGLVYAWVRRRAR